MFLQRINLHSNKTKHLGKDVVHSPLESPENDATAPKRTPSTF